MNFINKSLGSRKILVYTLLPWTDIKFKWIDRRKISRFWNIKKMNSKINRVQVFTIFKILRFKIFVCPVSLFWFLNDFLSSYIHRKKTRKLYFLNPLNLYPYFTSPFCSSLHFFNSRPNEKFSRGLWTYSLRNVLLALVRPKYSVWLYVALVISNFL